MKYLLFLLLVILIASSLCANTTPALQKSQYAQEIYFSFEITERSELEQLTRIVDIDNVKGNIVYAYAIPEELAKLKKLGYKIELLPVSGSSKDLTMATTIAEMANWDRYPTYDVYIAMMYQFASDYPSICQLENIGYSIENREILTVKISDNPDIEEDEPEFFYTAQMHGDEIVTYIMMLRLIDYILSHYGTDAEITEMVNEIEIWINPLANPDGTYHGGNNTVSGARRYLANNVDPNRNFPDPEDGPHPDGHPWAPETIMMMDFADEHRLIHSANFHSGAEVVNYPWDTWYTLHADDDWYIDISKAYADTVFANSTGGYLQSVSTNGYIRGCLWYVIAGGRQDYMNYFQACREVTIELSDTKDLSSDLLPAHWTYNKRSFINYIKNVYYGIRGLVTDSLGNPLDAEITVVDHDFDHSEVYTDPEVGDYHRMLLPGVYDITVSSYAFIPQTITNITVSDTGATRVDVMLVEAESVDITGTVRDGDTNLPIPDALVEIIDSVHAPVHTGFNGTYAIYNVMEGTYTFKVSAGGYSTLTEDITVTEDNSVINFELFAPYLFWDFELNDGDFTSNNPSGWQWGEPSAGDITAYSGVKVWGTVLNGYYLDDADWTLDSPAIQLGNNPMLEFYHLHYFEEGYSMYDGGNVSISTN
ncbi:MAG: M14 family zinc carboxypeptidase, partial [Candidatus Electryonea clarkiae]|nr:M14 family zinc carboxypeptidase [Candidatus Electryonea clarkiae]